MGVRVCEICKEEHDYQSGFFTRHLKECHDISLEDYVILTEYNNIQPKCECGLCEEKPKFFRGKFKTHAPGHRKSEFKQKMYLGKYGDPKCPTCGDIIEKWNRGEPRKYFSVECQPSKWNQERVKKTVKRKYGVDNVFQIPSIIESNKLVDKNSEKAQITKKEKYQNGSFDPNIYKESMLKNHGVEHASQIDKNRESASLRMIEFNKNLHKNFKIKKYKNTDLYYQSSYELEFMELCKSLNILDKIKNGNTYKIGNKRILTDFSIGDYEIEIKSSYFLKKQGGVKVLNEKRDTVISNGEKYIFILDKDYSEFLDIIENNI